MTDSTERKLSTWAENISPSPTLEVDAKAKALKAAGEDVCGFGAGEPDFDTPEFIKEAAIRALREGRTKYAPAAGIPELRRALAERWMSVNGIARLDPSQVIVSPGGKFSCYLAILAVCSPGDEVLVPAPYWVSYPEMVKLSGATPSYLSTDDTTRFRISPEQFEEAITPRTRLLILNSPSNPTGAAYTREELEKLVEVALRRNVYILSDEIYEQLLYDEVEHCSPASFSEDAARAVITVSGFSKTYAMTGWRLGTMAAPPLIAKAVADLQSQIASNATTFAQYGALEALRNEEAATSAVGEMLKVFDRRRRTLHCGLTAIDRVSCVLAQGAFYLFPRISDLGMDSTAFASALLEKEKVAAVPGAAFGADEYLRLSYAVADEIIEKGVERLGRFCESLH